MGLSRSSSSTRWYTWSCYRYNEMLQDDRDINAGRGASPTQCRIQGFHRWYPIQGLGFVRGGNIRPTRTNKHKKPECANRQTSSWIQCVLALLYSPGFSYWLGAVSPYIYVPCELAKPYGFASFTVTHLSILQCDQGSSLIRHKVQSNVVIVYICTSRQRCASFKGQNVANIIA